MTTKPSGTALRVAVHAVLLWAFWILLSGKMDPFYLSIGLLCSIGVAIWTRKLQMVDFGPRKIHIVQLPWYRWWAYIPWLLWEIVLSSLRVAWQVLHPKEIKPRLIRIRVELNTEVAHLTLANSITLTPGTVTVDRDGDEFLIHALSDVAGEGLLAGDMQKRVARVFSHEVEREDLLEQKKKAPPR